MKKTFTTILLFIPLFFFSQEKEEINYISIPNTKISIPVSNFKLIENSTSLIKNGNGIIQIMELLNDSFQNQALNLTETAFTSKGGVILDKKDLKVENFDAKYMSIKSPDNKILKIILFGDTTFCVAISAINNNINDKETNNEIDFLFEKIKYDKTKIIDNLKNAPFSLNISSETYKFKEYTANMYVFIKNDLVDSPKIIISSFPYDDNFSILDVFNFSIEMLEKYSNDKIKSVLNKKITPFNKYDSIRNVFDLNINGKLKKNYLLILTNKKMYLQIQGTCDNEKEIKEIEDFIKNLKLKE